MASQHIGLRKARGQRPNSGLHAGECYVVHSTKRGSLERISAHSRSPFRYRFCGSIARLWRGKVTPTRFGTMSQLRLGHAKSTYARRGGWRDHQAWLAKGGHGRVDRAHRSRESHGEALQKVTRIAASSDARATGARRDGSEHGEADQRVPPTTGVRIRSGDQRGDGQGQRSANRRNSSRKRTPPGWDALRVSCEIPSSSRICAPRRIMRHELLGDLPGQRRRRARGPGR